MHPGLSGPTASPTTPGLKCYVSPSDGIVVRKGEQKRYLSCQSSPIKLLMNLPLCLDLGPWRPNIGTDGATRWKWPGYLSYFWRGQIFNQQFIFWTLYELYITDFLLTIIHTVVCSSILHCLNSFIPTTNYGPHSRTASWGSQGNTMSTLGETRVQRPDQSHIL